MNVLAHIYSLFNTKNKTQNLISQLSIMEIFLVFQQKSISNFWRDAAKEEFIPLDLNLQIFAG